MDLQEEFSLTKATYVTRVYLELAMMNYREMRKNQGSDPKGAGACLGI